jgi:hypothetical protein
MEVSTVWGRRFVGGMGSGRSGDAGAVCWVSCSHNAQCGLCVRPSNALGAGECLGVGVMGVAGAVVGIALRLGQLKCNRTQSQMMANRASW